MTFRSGWIAEVYERARMRSAVVRKLGDFAGRVPRFVDRSRAGIDDYRRHPPVIVNSIPKSGTHLLKQLAVALPDARSYGSFIASVPSFPPIARSRRQHVSMIRAVAPGEVVAAHMYFDPIYAAAMDERNCVHLFVYRDPRDIAVSEALYLAHMNRWHYMHREFRLLPSDEARVLAAIRGLPDRAWRVPYPDIASRLAPYLGWLNHPGVLAIRYEDLIGPSRDSAFARISDFYQAHSSISRDREEMINRFRSGVRPERSHTFREGRAGKWAESFTSEQSRAFGVVGGELLSAMGYDG